MCLGKKQSLETLPDFGRNDYDRALAVDFEKELLLGMTSTCERLKLVYFRRRRVEFFLQCPGRYNSVLLCEEERLIGGGAYEYLFFANLRSRKRLFKQKRGNAMCRSLAFAAHRRLIFAMVGNSLQAFRVAEKVELVLTLPLGVGHYSLRSISGGRRMAAVGGDKNISLISPKIL